MKRGNKSTKLGLKKESKKINKEELKKKMLKKAIREKKAEALRQ